MVRRGGIYLLKDNYYVTNDVLKDKRPIVVLNVEKNDSFFSAVRMGVFKSFTDDANTLFIEFRVKGVKYFSSILCDKELEFHKEAIKEEIGILDEKTLKAIEEKLFKVNYDLAKKIPAINFDKSKNNTTSVDKEVEEVVVKADVVIKDDEELKKVIYNINEVAMYLKDANIKQGKNERKRKKYNWLLVIISNLSSFVMGICASYIANNYDKEIGNLFDKIKMNIISTVEKIVNFFL